MKCASLGEELKSACGAESPSPSTFMPAEYITDTAGRPEGFGQTWRNRSSCCKPDRTMGATSTLIWRCGLWGPAETLIARLLMLLEVELLEHLPQQVHKCGDGPRFGHSLSLGKCKRPQQTPIGPELQASILSQEPPVKSSPVLLLFGMTAGGRLHMEI